MGKRFDRGRTPDLARSGKAACSRYSLTGTLLAFPAAMLCRPIEGTRPDRFRPPHCPHADCPAHVDRGRFRCSRAGSYRRAHDPRRKRPRFLCSICKRTFSLSSFSVTYYLKRPELLQPIAAGLVAGSAHRQIARTLGCAPSTVTRLSARIGRHALLLQCLALEQIGEIKEPVGLDHFETFVFSQLDRLGIATPVGQRSWFLYGIEGASHRMAGKRSVKKVAVRGLLPERMPGSVTRSTVRILDLLVSLASAGLALVSDDNPSYRSAVEGHPARQLIHRRVYPNPPRGPGSDTAAARERDRQMYPVDALHKLWRHTQAHHRRETIAFGRRSNAVLERAALMMCWRNFVKGVSERLPDPTTPAMRLELTPRPWSWRDVFSRRLFPGRLEVPSSWMRIYRRMWTTPAVGRNTRHDLRYAF